MTAAFAPATADLPPVFSADQYQLLDFGDGRRLERFGPWVLDRPAPAAELAARRNPSAWQEADARFDRDGEGESGRWTGEHELPPRWTIRHAPFSLELKRTEFGHLGVFPEQAGNWDWIGEQVCAAGRPVRVLNLFAYTGASTLAAAAAGAQVTHVDGARNVVAWARQNAGLSGLAEAPIRWIAEDAQKFVRRELKRGNRYDAVILDPPSYGHGPHGEVWRLSKHLPWLLQACGRLTAGQPRFMLLTCHTPGFSPERLRRLLLEAIGDAGQCAASAEELAIAAATGQRLRSGVAVRCAAV